MAEIEKFNFGSDSVAKAYDSMLVPTLFEPWAKSLIKENQPWSGNYVLDLACGTGVVTKELAKNVTPKGKVIALDINEQMIELAKLKCSEWADHVEYIVGSAEVLEISDNSIDKVICQQGFQFFPNKKVVAQEIFRVLQPKGKAIFSTWCPVSECEIFGVICNTLESLNLSNLSQLMRVPFDFLSQKDLLESFNGIGFSNIHISKQEKAMFLNGDTDKVITFAYSTPIGPKLNALSREVQAEFKSRLMDNASKLKQKNGIVSQMASNILSVEK
ncbi:MAG: class I SAM-dependent methyltransferase [Bacteroidota bacterium]